MAASRKRKRRNPNVAEYLGLSALRTDVSSQSNGSAFTHSSYPAPLPGKAYRICIQETLVRGNAQEQGCVSGGMHIKLASGQLITSEGTKIAEDSKLQTTSKASANHTKNSVNEIFSASQNVVSTDTTPTAPSILQINATSHVIRAHAHTEPPDAEVDDGSLLRAGSDSSIRTLCEIGCEVQSTAENIDKPHNDDVFDDGLEDNDLMMLAFDVDDHRLNSQDSDGDLRPPSDASSQWPDPDTAVCSSNITHLTQPSSTFTPFVLPVKQDTQSHSQDPNEIKNRKPIVRTQFPAHVQDCSPIIGLSANTCLRTCFRIGEAINTSSHAAKDGKNIILELYARVLSSSRDTKKQSFVFCDLYHEKPPYITAEYDAALWRPVSQFEFDARRLLQGMKICRCIGKMKREGNGWRLHIMSIWEATWEDIYWVEGIVNAA